jgi:serine/threonine protein kinase
VDTNPPINPTDITLFWTELSAISKAIRTIHGPSCGDASQSFNGWHADVKPANILRFGNSWRIADFGLSSFVETENGKPPELIMAGGTRMYGKCSLDSLASAITDLFRCTGMWQV